MKKIFYKIAVFATCVTMLAYVPEGRFSFVLLNVILVGLVSFFSLLSDLNIYFFRPDQKRFRSIVSEIEWRLWGFGKGIYNDDLIKEFDEIVKTKAEENIQSDIDFEKSNREFLRRLRNR